MVAQDDDNYGFDLVYRMECRDTSREVARCKLCIVFVARETRKLAEVPEAFLRRVTDLNPP